MLEFFADNHLINGTIMIDVEKLEKMKHHVAPGKLGYEREKIFEYKRSIRKIGTTIDETVLVKYYRSTVDFNIPDAFNERTIKNIIGHFGKNGVYFITADPEQGECMKMISNFKRNHYYFLPLYEKKTKQGGDIYIPSFLVFGYRRLKENTKQEATPEELKEFVENTGNEYGQTVKEINDITDIPIKEPFANPGYYSIIDRVMRHSEIGANDYWVLDDFPE